MRVISGKFKSRRLTSFQANHLRPTTDRVKESVFNKLTSEVLDANVLDLFSGTGSLGIEAFSRGANSVTFVDMSQKSISILKKNLQILGILRDPQIRVFKEDVFKFIKNCKDLSFDLIFMDPPFTKKIAHEAMETISLASHSILKLGGTLVIESGPKERLEDNYLSYILLDQRRFGDKTISFFGIKE